MTKGRPERSGAIWAGATIEGTQETQRSHHHQRRELDSPQGPGTVSTTSRISPTRETNFREVIARKGANMVQEGKDPKPHTQPIHSQQHRVPESGQERV